MSRLRMTNLRIVNFTDYIIVLVSFDGFPTVPQRLKKHGKKKQKNVVPTVQRLSKLKQDKNYAWNILSACLILRIDDRSTTTRIKPMSANTCKRISAPAVILMFFNSNVQWGHSPSIENYDEINVEYNLLLKDCWNFE